MNDDDDDLDDTPQRYRSPGFDASGSIADGSPPIRFGTGLLEERYGRIPVPGGWECGYYLEQVKVAS